MARIAFSENEERFIRRQVEAGNYADEGDVVSAGLRILQELEDARENGSWRKSRPVLKS